MTAFVDFESALIGMVSRNFPVSEHGGVAVCMVWLLLSLGGNRIFPPPAQFPPLITDRGSVTETHSVSWATSAVTSDLTVEIC